MKVLVTGGTGFVGRHLIDALLRHGETVTALVRTPAKAAGFAERGVRLLPGDLSDLSALRAAARDQEVIYHAAGLVAARSEADFHTVNRDGVARLIAAAAEVARPRIVLLSSLAAGGPSARGARLRGDEPANPVTAYGRSKLAGETAVRQGTLPWTIVRPPAVYGPNDTELLRVFKAVKLGLVPVFGNGMQELSLVYGPDLAEAVVALGQSGLAQSKIYYPCHPEVLTSAALLAAIAGAMGRRVRPVALPRWVATGALGLATAAARLTGHATILTPDKANEFFAPAWTCDPSALESETGWRATHDIGAGAAATVAWYRSAGWL